VKAAQTVWVNTASGKDHLHKNLSELTLRYRSVYNQIALMSEETNNPVYTVTTDKLQLVLMNVLIRSIF